MSLSQSIAWSLIIIVLMASGFAPQLIAQEEKNEIPVQAADDKQTQEAESLFAKTVKDEEKVWLTVSNSRLLALYLSDTSGRPHGAVLIVPQAGRRPSSDGLVNALRHSLSDNRWHTLTLDMTLETGVNGAMDEKAVQEAIKAGIDYLSKQSVARIVVLGEGTGALHALQYAAQLSETGNSTNAQLIRALIMINAPNTLPYINTNPLQTFEKIRLPILDAYLGDDFHSQQLAKQRKKAASRQNNANLQQIRLPRTVVLAKRYENRTTKHIRGWLDKNVAGLMMQK